MIYSRRIDAIYMLSFGYIKIPMVLKGFLSLGVLHYWSRFNEKGVKIGKSKKEETTFHSILSTFLPHPNSPIQNIPNEQPGAHFGYTCLSFLQLGIFCILSSPRDQCLWVHQGLLFWVSLVAQGLGRRVHLLCKSLELARLHFSKNNLPFYLSSPWQTMSRYMLGLSTTKR